MAPVTRPIRSAVISAITLACALIAGPAAAREEIISFKADVQVLAGGDLEVVETIEVRAEGRQIRRGIFRDFPIRYTLPSGLYEKATFDVRSVTRDGKPEHYAVEHQGDYKRLRIGHRDIFLKPAIYLYQIRYRTSGQMRYGPDFDELAWNVTDNFWQFPILSAEARIRLPDQAGILQYDAYTGPFGARGKAFTVVSKTGNTIAFASTLPIPPGSGLTIAVGWQKGVVAVPGTIGRLVRLLSDNFAFFILIAGVAVVGGYYVTVWRRAGRDPGPARSFPFSSHRKTFRPAPWVTSISPRSAIRTDARWRLSQHFFRWPSKAISSSPIRRAG